MTSNIHPIFVHFPIAFLLLYSLITILPFEKWLPKISWRQTRLVLLVAGFLGALASLSTGEVAEHIVRPDRNIVEIHAFFGSAMTWFYGLILLGEVLRILNPLIVKIIPDFIMKIFVFVEKITTNRSVVILLSVLGVIAVFVTGLLGGVMVYGDSADPLAPFVLKILGL